MNAILFRDLLMNMLLGLTALVILVLFNINPEAKKQSDTKVAGQLIVSIEWPQGSQDVDLWVAAPEDNQVGYSQKNGKVFNLLRDDLGTTNDGSLVNREEAFARTLPAGEYVVNIHGYRLTEEQKVHFEVRMMNESGSNLLVSSDSTVRQGQERTIVSFRIDANGQVVPGSINHVYKPLRSGNK